MANLALGLELTSQLFETATSLPAHRWNFLQFYLFIGAARQSG